MTDCFCGYKGKNESELPVIIFAVPLRSKASSRCWKKVQKDFNKTLHSIFNQTNSKFKCIVACTDLPELYHSYDDRLEFILVDSPTPIGLREGDIDKIFKLMHIAERAKDILKKSENYKKGVFFMPVDADDLISNRIAEYCEKNFDKNGFNSYYGYVSELFSKSLLRKYDNLHDFCGSCNVLKMYLDDFPKKIDNYKDFLTERDDWCVYGKHVEIPEKYAAMGRPFSKFPFPSTIYVLDTGNNLSSNSFKEFNDRGLYCSVKDYIYCKFRMHMPHVAYLYNYITAPKKYEIFTQSLKKEFGLLDD